MKKCKKTYAVSGLMEYVAIIRAGRSVIRVPFSGGSMNAIGVTPAKFTTDDFMIQHAIEHSSDFQRGKITLYKKVELNGEVRVLSARGKNAAKHDTGTAVSPATTDGAGVLTQDFAAEDTAADAAETTEQDRADINEAEAPAQDFAAEGADEEFVGGALVRVEVSCHEEAVEYLRDKYNIASSKLRSKVAVSRYAEQFGIEFIYSDTE